MALLNMGARVETGTMPRTRGHTGNRERGRPARIKNVANVERGRLARMSNAGNVEPGRLANLHMENEERGRPARINNVRNEDRGRPARINNVRNVERGRLARVCPGAPKEARVPIIRMRLGLNEKLHRTAFHEPVRAFCGYAPG
jgi:hypothetical protein